MWGYEGREDDHSWTMTNRSSSHTVAKLHRPECCILHSHSISGNHLLCEFGYMCKRVQIPVSKMIRKESQNDLLSADWFTMGKLKRLVTRQTDDVIEGFVVDLLWQPIFVAFDCLVADSRSPRENYGKKKRNSPSSRSPRRNVQGIILHNSHCNSSTFSARLDISII
jgi:hypothetical protein